MDIREIMQCFQYHEYWEIWGSKQESRNYYTVLESILFLTTERTTELDSLQVLEGH